LLNVDHHPDGAGERVEHRRELGRLPDSGRSSGRAFTRKRERISVEPFVTSGENTPVGAMERK
jgi:hypothetical protein